MVIYPFTNFYLFDKFIFDFENIKKFFFAYFASLLICFYLNFTIIVDVKSNTAFVSG